MASADTAVVSGLFSPQGHGTETAFRDRPQEAPRVRPGEDPCRRARPVRAGPEGRRGALRRAARAPERAGGAVGARAGGVVGARAGRARVGGGGFGRTEPGGAIARRGRSEPAGPAVRHSEARRADRGGHGGHRREYTGRRAVREGRRRNCRSAARRGRRPGGADAGRRDAVRGLPRHPHRRAGRAQRRPGAGDGDRGAVRPAGPRRPHPPPRRRARREDPRSLHGSADPAVRVGAVHQGPEAHPGHPAERGADRPAGLGAACHRTCTMGRRD